MIERGERVSDNRSTHDPSSMSELRPDVAAGQSSTGETSIRYFTVDDFPGWGAAPSFLDTLVARYAPKTILEVGSGANPTMSIDDVRRWNIQYITSDIDENELKKADSIYTTYCMDFSQGVVPADLTGRFDLIFSRMVNEHVKDGRLYHSNIFRMLAPGGIAVHAFSTLYALPFLVNYMMPVALSEKVLKFFSPRDVYQHGKFPAYYSWSRGPTGRSIAGFRKIGYEVISYDGYFGHEYYRHKSKFIHRLERLKSQLMLKVQTPMFCAYGVVVLRKPSDAALQ